MAARKATTGQIEAALRASDGVKAKAAKMLGLTRQAVHLRVEADAHLQQVIREVDEMMLDLAESNIFKAMRKGDVQTSKWFAERKGGKKRGYATKIESETKIADTDLEAIILSFGGDLGKLRTFRQAIGPQTSVE